MASAKISAMPAASALSGPELLAGVQSAANVKITAAQVKTFTSDSPTLVAPVLGTVAAGSVLTNATGLPVSTGISGLGTGVATFLATPSSANLLAAVTDETGTGALVFGTSPTFTGNVFFGSAIVVDDGSSGGLRFDVGSGATLNNAILKDTGNNETRFYNGATVPMSVGIGSAYTGLSLASNSTFSWMPTTTAGNAGVPDTTISRVSAGVLGLPGIAAASPVRTSGVAPYLTVTAPADTTLTASTEAIGVSFVGATRQHATGALTTQREVVFAAPTYSFAGASTVTTAATVAIAAAPVAGTNATITNSYALWVQSGAVSLPAVSGNTNPPLNFGTIGTGLGGNSTSVSFISGAGEWTRFVVDAVIQRDSGRYCWGAAGQGPASQDTSLFRSAAGVVGAGTGASVLGWFVDAGITRVTGDVTNATATMANITGLSATLIAGRKYCGRVVLFASDSTAADGLQFDFDGGTVTATSFVAGIAGTPIGATTGVVYSTALATDLTNTVVSTGDVCYVIEFEIVVNAAGTFIPRFSQVAHTTGTATVRLGSYMNLRDCPV
jgi:hypothetical protein